MDNFEVLGVKRNATWEQIRKAYFKKALRFHPDKNSTGEEEFKKISAAYKILKDQHERSKLDQTYREKQTGPEKSHEKHRRKHSQDKEASWNSSKWKIPSKSNLKMYFLVLGSMVCAYTIYKMIWNHRAPRAAMMEEVAHLADTIAALEKISNASNAETSLTSSLSSATSAVASATAGGISKIWKWTTGSSNAATSLTSFLSSATSAVASATAGGISKIWKWTTGS